MSGGAVLGHPAACRRAWRAIGFTSGLSVIAAGCAKTSEHAASAASPAPARAPAGAAIAEATDEDGVIELYPSAPGASFRLGDRDPNRADRFEIEKHAQAARKIEGALAFWTVAAYPLEYASGGAGKTLRLHIHASGPEQRFTWRTQEGYLSREDDLRNQELTAYVRAHGIFDARRAAVTLKVRGGAHGDRNGDLASCTMVTFAPKASGAASRFGKELHHPDYDYVPLSPEFDAALEDNRWVALKLVTFALPGSPSRVKYELYVDTTPFEASGRPANHFRRFSEYVDVEGQNTGHYAKLADWGGWQTTVRADGIASLDFTLVSAREIAPPK